MNNVGLFVVLILAYYEFCQLRRMKMLNGFVKKVL